MKTRADVVDELNKTHAILAGAGRVRVMRFLPDDTFELESVFDFRVWCANRTIREKNKKGEPIDTPIADVWLQHHDRRQFEGIVFDPRESETRAFNMWRGFSVSAKRHRGYKRFLEHLLLNVCGGNTTHFLWLVGWMAHLIQRPWEKPGVAVVLKGAKGVGKTIVGEIMSELLKHHTVTVSQPRHLVGNFNAHLARAVLVLVEEAFWAGDRTAEGALKDQITGATIRVERKGFDVQELPSFHRYMITGNADWIVPATHDDRRYAVFNVSDARKEDHEYFGRMIMAMELGGYEGLLHHLKNFDLSLIDVRKAPRTEGLAQQKAENLHGVQAWWFDLLTEGVFPGWDAEGDWCEGEVRIVTEQLRSTYKRWHFDRKFQGELVSEAKFGRQLRDMCPSSISRQTHVKGENVRRYHFPALHTCRAEFQRWLGVEKIDWPDYEGATGSD
jgi:hypothetical protein